MGSILETENKFQGGISRRSFTNDACVQSIALNGGAPLILPLVSEPELLNKILNFCDGLLFPGGVDVDPAYYHEERHKKLGAVNHDLDKMWLYAADFAIKNKIPMLGICRGMQLLNVAYGGTLYQDLSEHIVSPFGGDVSYADREGSSDKKEREVSHLQRCARDLTAHDVNIKNNTRLYNIFNNRDILSVNTMHHQAVKDVGDGLLVSACCDSDGIIEGIESMDDNGFLLVAVQWHPEDLIKSEPIMNLLFKDFVNRAMKNKQ